MHSLPALYVDGVEDRNNSTLKPEVQIDCDRFLLCKHLYFVCCVKSAKTQVSTCICATCGRSARRCRGI